jgi:hypothetical protein
MKYFPLNNGKKLKAYLEELTTKDEASCAEHNRQLIEQIAPQKEANI